MSIRRPVLSYAVDGARTDPKIEAPDLALHFGHSGFDTQNLKADRPLFQLSLYTQNPIMAAKRNQVGCLDALQDA